ncbi:MAG: hypothetical protein VYC52_09510 [Pseudomonadota bacterium]|nr:hypothetical protein [Pseudomonadota bacterium]
MVVVCLSALQSVAARGRSYVNPSSPGGSGSQFSGAVLTDDTLYISGTLLFDARFEIQAIAVKRP